eukprot:1807987-Alexandrium_andersonii.AAC.1
MLDHQHAASLAALCSSPPAVLTRRAALPALTRTVPVAGARRARRCSIDRTVAKKASGCLRRLLHVPNDTVE